VRPCGCPITPCGHAFGCFGPGLLRTTNWNRGDADTAEIMVYDLNVAKRKKGGIRIGKKW
jgi:hypothetical protein